MLKLINEALRNPLFLSACSLIFGIFCIYVSQAGYFSDIVSGIATSVGQALIVAAVFGTIFEYFGKLSLINNSVRLAMGQSRCSSLGVGDFVINVKGIQYVEQIRCSRELSISSRYSSLFLANHRDEIFKRLKEEGKPLTFLKMSDTARVPKGQGPNLTPEDFFRSISRYDASILALIEILETDRFLSYNYIRVDTGIWVKLYFNSDNPDAPPAFFALKGTDLYNKYNQDIDRLMSSAKKVSL